MDHSRVSLGLEVAEGRSILSAWASPWFEFPWIPRRLLCFFCWLVPRLSSFTAVICTLFPLLAILSFGTLPPSFVAFELFPETSLSALLSFFFVCPPHDFFYSLSPEIALSAVSGASCTLWRLSLLSVNRDFFPFTFGFFQHPVSDRILCRLTHDFFGPCFSA